MIDDGRARAEEILLLNGSELGLLGGGGGAYRQVWARDSMICGLALLLLDRGREVHRQSLRTLEDFQSDLGKIPHNVGFPHEKDVALGVHGGSMGKAETRDESAETAEVATARGTAVKDTAHAGCVDDNPWFILGHYANWAATADLDTLRAAWPAIKQALLWLRYQDSNECGLIEAQEASDWADLFPNRYNTLYANALYVAAWRAMAKMAAALGESDPGYERTANETAWKLNQLLWVEPAREKDWDWIDRNRREWRYPLRLVETVLGMRPYYLPYMGFRGYGDHCDTLGNALAILFGLADERQIDYILTYMHQSGLDKPFPIRALDHPIRRGDPDWRDYLLFRDLNKPDHYHNGGIWPFIGGFYVAALVAAGRHERAAEQLRLLAELNRQGIDGEWEFREWAHGKSGRPMGFKYQSWSAAMYIYAYEAVKRGKPPLLDGLRLTPPFPTP